MRRTPRPLSRLRGGRPPLRSLLPDLALGLIAALGLAPLGIWAATPLAMAALIWRLSPLPAAAVFWHVLAAGFGWFALSLSWITEPFLVDIARHGWMAPFALILMAFGGALFWAVPAGAAARLARGPAAQATAIAAALVLSDWLHYLLGTTLAQIVDVFNFHLHFKLHFPEFCYT